MRKLYANMAIVATCAAMLLSAPFAAFAQQFPTGKWQGGWTNEGQKEEILPATLEVKSIEQVDGKLVAAGVSTWGESRAWDVRPGNLTFKAGEVTGTKLVIGKKIVLEFELQPDGTLKGRRIIDGKTTGVITMRRADTAAAKN